MANMSSRWIEVDRSALIHNFKQVQALVGPACGVLAVVKANAYGLGMTACAQIFQEQGAAMLGVTTFEEGVDLRQAGLTLPILVFGPVLPEQVAVAADYGLTVTVTSRAAVAWLIQGMEASALKARCAIEPIRVHLKIETGMGRFGLWPDEAVAAAQAIQAHPGLKLAGIYTHFATAGQSGTAYFQKQWADFQKALENLEQAGIRGLVRHCANSAALLKGPAYHLDMVRSGTLLYGQAPAGVGQRLNLQDPWRFCAKVLEVRQLPAGQGVGYGATYRTKKTTRVAVLPVGFVDGVQMEPILRPANFLEALKGTAKLWLRFLQLAPLSFKVFFEGGPAPVIGKIGMQLTMVDVTDLPQVEVGSVAQVPLRRTAPGKDIPRAYIESSAFERNG